jgi:hypothetical protein
MDDSFAERRRSIGVATLSFQFHFLSRLPAEVPLIVEEPNKKCEDQHGRNQPGLDRSEVGQDGRSSNHSKHVADGIQSGFPM